MTDIEGPSAEERCLTFNWCGLAISLAYLSREERGYLQVQMISTCFRGAWGGGGVSTLSPYNLEQQEKDSA